MARRTRREFLQEVGLGAAAFSVGPLWIPKPARRTAERDLDAFARKITASPLEDALRLAVRCAREGWTRDQILGGVYVAAAREVRPALGGISHCMMVVPSASLLANAAPEEDAFLPVLFALADFKRSQERDRRQGDFVLPPAPETDLPPARAGRALREALEAWDEEASDRAAVAAARAEDLDELFERLWALGVRDFHNIGHKVIFTAHAYRAIRLGGRSVAQPALRSLAVGLLLGRDADRVGFEENLERAAALPAEGAAGAEDPQASRELLQELRTVSPKEAPAVVARMLERRVSPRSLWDGVRLAASELHLCHPGLLGVHPLTTTNAMHFVAATTRRDETRILMLLQAAAWIPAFRDFLPRRQGVPRGLRIDEPATDEPRPLAEILDSGDVEASFRGALALGSSAGGADALLGAIRWRVLRKGDESHYFRYAAAVAEERAHAHPAWGRHLLAANLAYLPPAGDSDSKIVRDWRAGRYEG